jgi:hypothetical protein
VSGICKECRHWFQAPQFGPLTASTGVCLLISARMDNSTSGPYKDRYPKATAMDSDGVWTGYLLTDMHFGCFEFEDEGGA